MGSSIRAIRLLRHHSGFDFWRQLHATFANWRVQQFGKPVSSFERLGDDGDEFSFRPLGLLFEGRAATFVSERRKRRRLRQRIEQSRFRNPTPKRLIGPPVTAHVDPKRSGRGVRQILPPAIANSHASPHGQGTDC
jgi:hypothetical protein